MHRDAVGCSVNDGLPEAEASQAGNVVHGNHTPVRYQGLAELDEHWPLIRRLLFDYVRDAPIAARTASSRRRRADRHSRV